MKIVIPLIGLFFLSCVAFAQGVCDDPHVDRSKVDCSTPTGSISMPEATVRSQIAQQDEVNSCAAWLIADGMRWSSQESKAKGAQYFLCRCQKAMQGRGTPPSPDKYQALGVRLANCSESAQAHPKNQLAMMGCGGYEISTSEGPQMVIPLDTDQHGVGAVRRVIEVLKGCPGCTWTFTRRCGGM